jgi:hypothetical protein
MIVMIGDDFLIWVYDPDDTDSTDLLGYVVGQVVYFSNPFNYSV